MKTLLTLTVCALMTACAAPTPDRASGTAPVPHQMSGSSGTRGGGDVDAVNFLTYAKQFSTWLKSAGNTPVSPAEKLAVESAVNDLIQGMDDKSRTPIRFVDVELTDDSGTPKMAVFSLNPTLILVNRSKWSALDLTSKYTLAALELFGVSGVEERYSAVEIVSKNIDAIAGIRRISDSAASTIGGQILKAFESLFKLSSLATAMAPPASRIVETSDDPFGVDFDSYQFGARLQDVERKRFDKLEKRIQDYHSLDTSFELDIIASGSAMIETFEVGHYSQQMIGMRFPSDILILNLRSYVEQVDKLLALYAKSSKGRLRSKLQDLSIAASQLLAEVEDTEEKNGITSITAKSAFSAFNDAAATAVRKKLAVGKCKMPAGKKPFLERDSKVDQLIADSLEAPDVDLTALLEKAKLAHSDFSNRLHRLATAFESIQSEKDFAKVKIERVDNWHSRLGENYTKEFGYNTVVILRLAETSSSTLAWSVDQQFESVTRILAQIDDGTLCRQ